MRETHSFRVRMLFQVRSRDVPLPRFEFITRSGPVSLVTTKIDSARTTQVNSVSHKSP